MLRQLGLGIALAASIGAASAQDAVPQLVPSEADMQNFAAGGEGELRILGDPNRYDILLPADFLFDFDRAELRADAAPMLAKLKAHFAAHGTSQVLVWGHTDSKGSDSYNLTLSQKRAGAVCDWLKRETPVDFTNCAGLGEKSPLVPNENADGSDNPQNRQLNRRVTISVVLYPDTKQMLEQAKRDAEAAKAALPKLGN